MKHKKKLTLFDGIVCLILIVFCATILYPLLHLLAVSFSIGFHITANDISIFPRGFTLESYFYFLENQSVIRAYGNSIVYTVVGVICNVLFTVLTAYPLSKSYLLGRSFIMKLILFTLFFSGGMIPSFLVVKETGLLDSMWSLIIPNLIWTVNLIIMINFFRSLPLSLYDAAELDGASDFTVFRTIAVPLSKASIASITLFYFMGHWNSYLIPILYLHDKAKFPLQVVLRSMLMEDQVEGLGQVVDISQLTPTGVKNAVIVLSMIPVLIVYPFVQKYFVTGVMVGSVKG